MRNVNLNKLFILVIKIIIEIEINYIIMDVFTLSYNRNKIHKLLKCP